jgi:hypothetical protein
MRVEQKCNVSPSGNLVGMWERGEARPGRLYRKGLVAFTGLPEQRGGFSVPLSRGREAWPAGEEEADTKRREMLSSMMAAGVALSGFPLPAR